MRGSKRCRLLAVSAAALVAGALPHAGAKAQELSLPDMSGLCAQVAKASEAALKDFESRLAGELERMRANDNSNPLIEIRSQLRGVRNRIAAEQALIKDFEAQIAQARYPVGASALDASIKEQERLLVEVQAKRLAIQSGTDGKTGIDELQRLIAEIDRRVATNDFATGAERAAAATDRTRYTAALQARMTEKAGLATEFAAKRDELARLKRERDSLNPQSAAKIKNLETQLASTNKRLDRLRSEEEALRDKEDKLRKHYATISLGEAEVRGCIADRRRVLAAATQPTPPTKPDDPKTPGTPPPASAATATFSLGGVWNGQCNGSFAVSGQFTINAASGKVNGTYTGGDSGAIGGQISGSGQLDASGAGGGGGRSVRWTGSVTRSGSRWLGAGRWSSSGNSLACDGSWQSR
ncbi:MAG: hypothetical protein AB7O88_04545 [Reyranellaceae bacterium]